MNQQERSHPIPPLAKRVFGKEVIDSAVERPITILRGWGYQQQERHPFVACVAYLLLCNKSPHLEDLSIDLIEAVGQACRLRGVQVSPKSGWPGASGGAISLYEELAGVSTTSS